MSTRLRAPRPLTRWFLVALVALLVTACGGGGGGGPASFGGSASNATVYVTWTRSGDALSGQLTQAVMPENPGAGDVTTSRVGFSGTVNDKAVSLRLDQGLGTSTTLTGKLDGDTLTLDYPGQDGGVTTIRLRHGDSAAYNRQLAALRDRLHAAQQQAAQEAADAEASADAVAAVDNVRRQIDTLAQAAENATAANPGLYASDLDTIRSDLDTAKSSYEVFTEDQQNGYTDSYCQDAGSLASDVNNLRHDINAMRSDVKDNTAPSLIDGDVSKLREQFAALQGFDPSLLPADTPTQADVDAAIRAARHTVKSAGGGDFAAAQKLLDQAKALQATAQAACDRAGG